MGQDVFSASGITSITIGSGLRVINTLEFRDCNSITSFTVSADNQYFASEDGVMYDKYKNKILYYPKAKSATTLTLPSNITTFGDQVFPFGCTISTFTLTNGQYTSISNDRSTIFDNVDTTRLIRVAPGYSGLYTVPTSIKILANGAFSNCCFMTGVL